MPGYEAGTSVGKSLGKVPSGRLVHTEDERRTDECRRSFGDGVYGTVGRAFGRAEKGIESGRHLLGQRVGMRWPGNDVHLQSERAGKHGCKAAAIHSDIQVAGLELGDLLEDGVDGQRSDLQV